MHNMPSRNHVARWLRFAAEDIEVRGTISPSTQMRLESVGFDVGALERRLLDQQEAA